MILLRCHTPVLTITGEVKAVSTIHPSTTFLFTFFLDKCKIQHIQLYLIAHNQHAVKTFKDTFSTTGYTII